MDRETSRQSDRRWCCKRIEPACSSVSWQDAIANGGPAPRQISPFRPAGGRTVPPWIPRFEQSNRPPLSNGNLPRQQTLLNGIGHDRTCPEPDVPSTRRRPHAKNYSFSRQSKAITSTARLRPGSAPDAIAPPSPSRVRMEMGVDGFRCNSPPLSLGLRALVQTLPPSDNKDGLNRHQDLNARKKSPRHTTEPRNQTSRHGPKAINFGTKDATCRIGGGGELQARFRAGSPTAPLPTQNAGGRHNPLRKSIGRNHLGARIN